MIDSATANAFDRIASRADDVRNAYRPGFVPSANDVVQAPRIVASPDPLGVAIGDDAYVVEPGGGGGLAYSRDVALHFTDGELRTSDERPVLGFGIGTSALGAMRIDPYDGALGRARAPRVETDGTVSYARTTVDPRTGQAREERVAIGRLALARFPAGTQPMRCEDGRVRAPAGIKALVGRPGDGTFAPLVTHARDLGRVDITRGLEKMREAYVTYEALRAARHGHGEAEKVTMDLVK